MIIKTRLRIKKTLAKLYGNSCFISEYLKKTQDLGLIRQWFTSYTYSIYSLHSRKTLDDYYNHFDIEMLKKLNNNILFIGVF